MSINKVNSDGSLSRIAGRGTVEFGASTVRSGTVSVSGSAWRSANIVFDTPMPDANYELALHCGGETQGVFTTPLCIENKTANGFTLKVYFQGSGSTIVTYTAFKLHSVEGLEELENSIANFDAVMPENASTDNKLVTQEDIADSGWKAWTTVVSDGSGINYSYTADKDAEFVVNWWCTGSTGYIYIHVNNVMVHALNIGVGGVQATAFQPIHAGDTIKIQLTGGINGNVKRRLHN